jgi:acetolactate synthase I/II/III large subunit
MKVVDAIAEILKREGVEFLSTYPTTPVIDSAAAVGIRPVLCRQERVGVGIADGFTRTTNGRRIGVFAMQYGPGAENAFPGVATAYSDSVPILILPLGHQRDRAQVFPLFSSARTYASVTKWVETLNQPEQVTEVMRRAFNLLKMGRPGPVMVEIPADVAVADLGEQGALQYAPVKATRPAGNARDVAAAARALLEARAAVIHAGQGVLYAEAAPELLELAELLQIPVMTTLEGKGAFPEDHSLALGTGGGGVMSGPVHHFLPRADLVFGVGCSFTKHGMSTTIPAGKTIIHITNDERDLNKNYPVEYPILGDAKLVLRQFIDAARDLLGARPSRGGEAAGEVRQAR